MIFVFGGVRLRRDGRTTTVVVDFAGFRRGFRFTSGGRVCFEIARRPGVRVGLSIWIWIVGADWCLLWACSTGDWERGGLCWPNVIIVNGV